MNFNQRCLLIKPSVEVPDVSPMKSTCGMHFGRGQPIASVSFTVLQVAVWSSFEDVNMFRKTSCDYRILTFFDTQNEPKMRIV